MTEGIQVRFTEHKGLGYFATRDFEVGERILVERVALSITNHDDILRQLEEVNRNFERLSVQEQQQYLRLHEWDEPVKVASLYIALNQKEIPPEDIDRLIHRYLIYVSNQFTMQEPSREIDGKIRPPISGLFLQGSIFNHSCDPNCNWTLLERPGHLVVQAWQPIKRGDELTITYLLNNSPSRENRQWDLWKKWGFNCACLRCQNSDDEYDARFRDIVKEQRHVYDYWNERQTGDRFPGRNEDGHEMSTSDIIKRRVDLLTETQWYPELFFAFWDMAEHLIMQHTEAEPAEEQDKTQLELARETMTKVVEMGKRLYSEDNILVTDAEHQLQSIINKLATPGN